MAGRSQYIIQIMATQTRFDLNAAIENWRNELAAQLELSADDLRELEKHLADSMADLQQRGLSHEESFWLARRRMGQPQQLAEEFVKAEPGKIWRDRLFWILFTYLVMGFVDSVRGLINMLMGWNLNWWQVVLTLIPYTFPLVFIILICIGKADRPLLWFTKLVGSRFRLGVLSAALIFLYFICELFTQIIANQSIQEMDAKMGIHSLMPPFSVTISRLIPIVVIMMVLSLFLVWLLPKSNQKAGQKNPPYPDYGNPKPL